MTLIWLTLAAVCGIVWAWISISQKLDGDRHQREARNAASNGRWEDAALSYKLAILSRLDAPHKVEELTRELDRLYRSRGIDADLNQLRNCPNILKTLGADTGSNARRNELIFKLYQETGEYLDSLPGPPIPAS